MRDNRVYWLQADLDRYDQSAQLWIARGDKWQSQVIQQWYDTHTLPPPDEAGLPAGPAPPGTATAHKPPKSTHWWKM